MTNKVKFLYLYGSSPLILHLATAVGEAFSQPRVGLATVAGINGITATWADGIPRNDCFTNLLDPNIFEPVAVGYPALGYPINVSMGIGVGILVNAINALPKGQKFMLGGYSQGAAIASSAMLMLRSGGSLFSSRGADFLGGVCFGNPRRQVDYRGEVGGTWSGAWDIPGSTTGGHGSFPTLAVNSSFGRLTDCEPTKWIEFAETDDIIGSTGGSTKGQNWTAMNASYLTSSLAGIITTFATYSADVLAAIGTASPVSVTDAIGKAFSLPGNGHVGYPFRPPPGDPDNGLTSYQIAVKWATAKANAYAVGSDVLPATPTSTSTAGWTTTLIPPAA